MGRLSTKKTKMFFKISRMVLESRRTRLLRHLNCQLLLYLFIATVCYVKINTLKEKRGENEEKTHQSRGGEGNK